MTVWGFLLWSLLGLGIGFVGLFIFIPLFLLIRNTLERRKVKKLIKQGKFLMPIDKKDFDHEKWKDLIQIDPEEVKNLNAKIFNKKEDLQNG